MYRGGLTVSFFLRPKDTNKNADGDLVAETVAMRDGAQDRYTTRHPSDAREAKSDAPLPGGSWRGGSKRTGKISGSKK
jgi:hypothetical protein